MKALALTLGMLAAQAQAATLQVTVLARDGQPLVDAVVLVTPASGARPAVPTSATITQSKMQFLPAVSVLPLGSKLKFSNLDGWEHHVRGGPAGLAAFSADAKAGFELRLAGRVEGQPPASTEVVLGQAGPLQLGCHIHGSMRGHVFVADTPWAAKTGADGVATFNELPEGAATLRMWHPEQLIDAAPSALSLGAVTVFKLPTTIQPRKRRAL
jgi:plastocyanin